jgi:aminoglycoside phosphotransferase (APT) family kinase protein
VGTDDQPLTEWRDEAAHLYLTVAAQIPASHQHGIEAFLQAPPPDARDALVFSHHDLGIEHVLVDPVTWTVTGIIDWTDAALVDPAYDFGLLCRDLGPAALRVAVDRYGTAANDISALVERAFFYARCTMLADLKYGIESGRDSYVNKSLAALDWLFPA